MDSRVEELTNDYIVEMMEVHLADLRESSESLKQCSLKIVDLSMETTKIMNSLDASDRDTMQKYIDAHLEEESICCKGLYLAGIKDGIRLLKSLNLL